MAQRPEKIKLTQRPVFFGIGHVSHLRNFDNHIVCNVDAVIAGSPDPAYGRVFCQHGVVVNLSVVRTGGVCRVREVISGKVRINQVSPAVIAQVLKRRVTAQYPLFNSGLILECLTCRDGVFRFDVQNLTSGQDGQYANYIQCFLHSLEF